MRRAWAGAWLVVGIFGCGGTAPPPAEPVAELVVAAPPTPPPPPPTNRCGSLFDGTVERVVEADPALPTACVDNPIGERAMRDRLTSEYHRSTEPGRVDVSFGCDPLRTEVRTIELVHELDYGGASHFTVARLTRPEEGDVEVRAVRLDLSTVRDEELTWEIALAGELTRFVGTIPRAELETLLPAVRAALVAGTREVVLPQPRGHGRATVFVPRVGAVSTPFSVRVTDADGHVLARRGQTETSGGAQRDGLGPTIASRDLWDLLEVHARWEVAQPDPVDAALIESALGALDDAPWGGPSYYALALRLRLAWSPARLLEPLALDPREAELEPRGPLGVRYADLDRTRAIVIDELVRRTGWDARRREDGSARPVAEVATEYLRECVTPGP